MNNDYCKCSNVNEVTTSFNDFYEFDICCSCGKILEDSCRPLNHFDGEYHVYKKKKKN